MFCLIVNVFTIAWVYLGLPWVYRGLPLVYPRFTSVYPGSFRVELDSAVGLLGSTQGLRWFTLGLPVVYLGLTLGLSVCKKWIIRETSSEKCSGGHDARGRGEETEEYIYIIASRQVLKNRDVKASSGIPQRRGKPRAC